MAKPKIFVSHSSLDTVFASKLVDDLNAAGAEAWMDVNDLGAGNFQQRISEALAKCEWFLLVLTPNALASDWVRMEVDAAIRLKHQKRIKELIFIKAAVIDHSKVPPLWGVFNMFDAASGYDIALSMVLKAIGRPSVVRIPTSMPTVKGGLIGSKLGDYLLQSLLGTGSMAEVYSALDAPLNRKVAVKVLPAALAADPNYVDRFRTEARLISALNHPNVVPVYAFGEIQMATGERLLYLVMPLLEESLRECLDERGKLPVLEAIQRTDETASGLEAAHNMGLVHRDVKPANILLDHGMAMLADFGIAREALFNRQAIAAQAPAAAALPSGRPEYMAPEQLRGEPVDQRVDIYSLGAVLYELLTGHLPHEGGSLYQVAALVLTEPIVPPSIRNSEIPLMLDQVVMKALAKIPTQRYPDMRSFRLALNAAIRSVRATVRTLAGGWQRKTARIPTWHPGANDSKQ